MKRLFRSLHMQLFLWAVMPVTFLLIAVFVALAQLMLPLSGTVVPYLYPLPALSMILSILFGPALGMAIGVMVTLIGGYIAGGSIELIVYLLVGTGLFFTLYLGFPQIRYFRHAFLMVTGKYDEKGAKGDTTHFRALTTALSATVAPGIGGPPSARGSLHAR